MVNSIKNLNDILDEVEEFKKIIVIKEIALFFCSHR